MSVVITPGALKVKALLPKSVQPYYDPSKPLDKKGVARLMDLLVQKGGKDAFPAITELSKLFFETATEVGATTPLSDYNNDSDERRALIDEFEHKVQAALNSNKSKQEKLNELNSIAAKVRPLLEKQNIDYLVGRGSMAAKMAQTGARGNPSQLSQGTASPLMAQDVKGNPIPIAITHSFAEGLTPAETYAMSFGGRASTVLSQLSTQKPGELFKRLTPTLFHEVISEVDCKTKNGILVPAKDAASVVGRYLAKTNSLVTEAEYARLDPESTVMVRSPMTCEAKEGVCQHCYGLAANGKLPEIGTNVGVLASQGVSETLTQAMLSTKHQGGVAGRQRNAYDEAANLLNNPKENFLDEATIAASPGVITKIAKDALNNHTVFVEDKPHFVDRYQDVIVSPGDSVLPGDRLSTGTVNPRKLAALRGIGAAREELAKGLRAVYSRSKPLDPRHFEVIARNLADFVHIKNPGSTNLLPGSVVKVRDLFGVLKSDSHEVPLSKAAGQTLAQYVGSITPGTELTPQVISDIKKLGVNSVEVTKTGIKAEPLLPGLQTAKLHDTNWVSRLAFSKLTRSIEDAATLGEKAPIHGYEPITSFVIGDEFGEGQHGKY